MTMEKKSESGHAYKALHHTLQAAKEEFGNEMQEKEECIRHLQSQYFVHQTAVRSSLLVAIICNKV